MFRLIIILLFSFMIIACASRSVVIVGGEKEAIDSKEVEVFFGNPPQCEFEIVAHIKIPGEYYSRASLINGFRERAADIGASVVQITFIQQSGASEYFGSARALRCH